MRVLALLPFLLAWSVPGAHAQQPWQPKAPAQQVPIWPEGRIPDPRPDAGPETLTVVTGKEQVAGRDWLWIDRVSVPTMTVFAPLGKASGTAVLVFPGGGYQGLAIDLEGTEVCDWLTAKGVVCAVLKYRVPAPRSDPWWGAYPASPIALEDAQRAIRLLRTHAAEYGVDPHKIGVLGFSAGGHLVAAVSVHFRDRIYAPVDAADRESDRPDFAVALYPGHLSRGDGTLRLNPDIANRVTTAVPPTFLLQNENDHVDTVWDAVSYWAALVAAGVPVELHSYADGGHAFGLRPTRFAATGWPVLVETWLHGLGMLPR
jgi:acetyl esterase/lipase